MGDHLVDVFVRDQRDRPIDGAKVTFADENADIGGVPFAEGRARITVPEGVPRITITASVGWWRPQKKASVPLTKPIDSYTFTFWRLANWQIGAAIIVVAGVLLFAFRRNLIQAGERDALEIRSGYVGQHVPGLTTVVLVHGVFGDDTTWMNKEASFATLLHDDPAFQSAINVFVFEYFSPKMGLSPSIPQLSQQLDDALRNSGITRDAGRIVFLSHSMGGIIVRQSLLTNRALIARVPFLFFYGTPTNGARLAQIAGTISGNPQLRGMLPLDSNDLLQSIRNQWQALPEPVPSSNCAFEILPTDGLIVVDQGSATALCQGTHPLTASHIDLVKPKDRQDPRYTVFADELRDALKSAP